MNRRLVLLASVAILLGLSVACLYPVHGRRYEQRRDQRHDQRRDQDRDRDGDRDHRRDRDHR